MTADFRIVHGELEGPGVEIARPFASNGRSITPTVIVIHYGVTRTLSGLVTAQRARGFWAHLSISDNRILQELSLEQMGSHAGLSVWKGRTSVNAFSIGIEINNMGPAISDGHGGFVGVDGRAISAANVVEAHMPGVSYAHWEKYSNATVESVRSVCLALTKHYDISDIVGHSDISPGRKIDPGPAFPLNELRTYCGFAPLAGHATPASNKAMPLVGLGVATLLAGVCISQMRK